MKIKLAVVAVASAVLGLGICTAQPADTGTTSSMFLFEAVASASADGVKSCLGGKVQGRQCAVMAGVGRAVQPVVGWPCSNTECMPPVAAAYMASVEIANSTMAYVAENMKLPVLGLGAMPTREQVVKAALEALMAMPDTTAKAIIESGNAVTKQRLTLDISGADGQCPMDWITDTARYCGDGRGWTVTKHGTTWFGAGYYNGILTKVSVATK